MIAPAASLGKKTPHVREKDTIDDHFKTKEMRDKKTSSRREERGWPGTNSCTLGRGGKSRGTKHSSSWDVPGSYKESERS